ncbi:hypothetical protein D9M69_660910 [compost metagenome]
MRSRKLVRYACRPTAKISSIRAYFRSAWSLPACRSVSADCWLRTMARIVTTSSMLDTSERGMSGRSTSSSATRCGVTTAR